MSSITTYKCDRCGGTSTDREELKLSQIGIGVKRDVGSFYYSPGSYMLQDTQHREAEWCEKCLLEVGVMSPRPKEEASTPSFPTLEDLLREIIREEITEVKNELIPSNG